METALERHVTLWQEHLGACGLMPGSHDWRAYMHFRAKIDLAG